MSEEAPVAVEIVNGHIASVCVPPFTYVYSGQKPFSGNYRHERVVNQLIERISELENELRGYRGE